MDAGCQTDSVLIPKPSTEDPAGKGLEENWKFLCETPLSVTSVTSPIGSLESSAELAKMETFG